MVDIKKVSLAPPREKIEFTGERCTPWITTGLLSEHLHRYLSVLELVEGKTVLDIACGEGYGAALMRNAGASSVLGIDIDQEIIVRANRIYGREELSFACGDIREDLNIPSKKFDVITCFETIEHIDAQDAFMAELARVLAPGGTLIISTPDAKRPGAENENNPFHEKELSIEEFQDLVGRHFAYSEMNYQRFVCGSVMSGPDGAITPNQSFWERNGFLAYENTRGLQHQKFAIISASDRPVSALSTGLLHDGHILASLRTALRAATE
ncbi:methyltransferase family protein [Litoreibacter ponti]|uniref:Methyltransferase family protein n=1 Tax=Litoreibacter ponti TaxID=1510457 RepID=A0A2T6BNS3_9RHOB|nr:class I SAM-dependent methyltransferase [Litoreibacter ponti]PTX57730.1 methyltransferase family protein [Litoreibacter ponti]